MRVREIMTRDAKACAARQSLSDAVQIMWDCDCGIVPVVDDERRVIGVITDRDICIACWSHGARPSDLEIEQTMSRDVKSCAPDATIAEAESIMQAHRVRRLPVVDGEGRLEGVVSMNDISREADREREQTSKKRAVRAEDVVHTLAAICRPRFGAAVAEASKPRRTRAS